jgi:hypothetical protein
MPSPRYYQVMRRAVAEYLAPRLCPDVIMSALTVVPADALALLRAGMVWSLSYDAGRLVGEVSSRDLLVAGHVELARRLADDETARRPFHRLLRGEPVTAAELEAAPVTDQIDAMLAQRCLGRDPTPAERDALAARATDDDDRRAIRALLDRLDAPLGTSWVALTDDPIRELTEDDARLDLLDLYDYVRSGDHAGCLRLLAAAVARGKAIEAAGEPFKRWPQLAGMCRLLTGDDQAAMGLLERLPLPASHWDWIEIFGPLGVARIQRAKDAVLAAVDRAFDGVPFPGPKHRSLFQAEAADNSSGCDQSRDHKGRWQDLPREHVLACQWALPHLSGESLQYYLPAIISFVVREHDQVRTDHRGRWIFESTGYHLELNLNDQGLRDYGEKRHRGFTREQFAAIAAFADYYLRSAEHRVHWHALAAGGAWPAATC